MLKISNANGQFVKLESPSITSFASYISPPTMFMEIVGNVNCCGKNDALSTSYATLTNGDKWNIDLDTPVRLGEQLLTINFKNVKTGVLYTDLLGTNIDLGYVEDNCASNECTLEDFSNHFVPLFQDAINFFLAGVGAPATAVVTFDDNYLEITGLPTMYMPTEAVYSTSRISILSSFGATDSKAFIADNALWLTPEFFGYTDGKIKDGVYNIDIKYTDPGGSYKMESNCAFIDILTKCKVAGTIKSLLEEYEKGKIDSVSSVVHVLHYALINGSNCGCNCAELCQVYNELYKILADHSDIINVDCGCQV